MARCRSCQAEIVWARTSAGRPMPLDAEPNPAGTCTLEHTAEGALLVRVDPSPPLEVDTRPRYTSHFATCPHADQHRKR